MQQAMSILTSHVSQEWYTPPKYVELVRAVLGEIDLDPATDAIPQRWIKARRFYTKEDDGLAQQWSSYNRISFIEEQNLWSIEPASHAEDRYYLQPNIFIETPIRASAVSSGLASDVKKNGNGKSTRRQEPLLLPLRNPALNVGRSYRQAHLAEADITKQGFALRVGDAAPLSRAGQTLSGDTTDHTQNESGFTTDDITPVQKGKTALEGAMSSGKQETEAQHFIGRANFGGNVWSIGITLAPIVAQNFAMLEGFFAQITSYHWLRQRVMEQSLRILSQLADSVTPEKVLAIPSCGANRKPRLWLFWNISMSPANGVNIFRPANVFLNPPFGKGTTGKSNQAVWSQRLISEDVEGRIGKAILLVNSTHAYAWFERLWTAYPVCCVRERIRFIKPDGSQGGQAKRGQTFVYFGPNVERFREVFSTIGRVILPEN